MKKKSFLTASLLVIGLSAFAVAPTYTYNFNAETATAAAGTVAGITVAGANTATWGVVSNTTVTAPDVVSNCLKIYTGAITGAANLTKFPTNGTDATLIWKQYPTGTAETKVGFSLRASGTSTYSSTPGLMQGYFCDAWSSANVLKARVYKLTSAGITNLDAGGYVSGIATATIANNIPFWMKVTIVGNSTVTINVYCSSDSITWSPLQPNIIDDGTKAGAVLTTGSSQLVYGLGNVDNTYLLDNITYIDNAGATALEPTSVLSAKVVSEEYYTLTGGKVNAKNYELKGLYILKQKLSDGSLRTLKVLLK